ncbi:MAG: DNA cytosine methyltransferase [Pseudomonas sp.]|nr:DNA cytosine methyltransferase [Pseudomonas sp.]
MTSLFRTQYKLPTSLNDEEINIDLFAGGGGASTGLEIGLGRPVHIAINHNPAAISMHEANHPGTTHYQSDVWAVDPVDTVKNRKVGWFHASPDCTHHSQAAAGQPRSKEIRDLSWVVIKWAGKVKPRIISLENVKQIRNWGPLVAKRCKVTGCVIKADGTTALAGEHVTRNDQFLVPDIKKRGRTWAHFINALKTLGYVVEHRLLKACDYGAPTTRERLFLIARLDGQPINWPTPSHAGKPRKGQLAYRTAAECIDWSLPSKSIFNRQKPLAVATLKRIANGLHKEVLSKSKPFIAPATAATAWMAQMNGGFNTTHSKPLTNPITTITNTGSQQQLVTASLVQLRKNCDSKSLLEPISTITASGSHHALLECTLSKSSKAGALRCAAFLTTYYGSGENVQALNAPMRTITTKDRLALVTVMIKGSPFLIVDISLRMLQPHELYAAQGFPSNYIISTGHDGRTFTKTEQVHMCGNSVSPAPMAAIARANNCWHSTIQTQEAA